jgi:hypothetical protein
MKEIKVGDKVDLGEPGIERFVTMELTQGDGEVATDGTTATMEALAPRRHFRLPEEDETYLDTFGLIWETINLGNVRWLIILDHPLPAGYKQKTATVAIRIEGGYPPGALDMAYFLPHLERADGKAIKSISTVAVGGVSYQQWSRHYSWREGVDSVATHHLRVKNWLEAEPRR